MERGNPVCLKACVPENTERGNHRNKEFYECVLNYPFL